MKAGAGAPGRLPGFDALKGLLIVLVVAWHTQVVTVQVAAEAGGLNRYVQALVWAGYSYFTLLAVPTFLIVSLWLYAMRRDGTNAYVIKRQKRLGVLFAAWAAVQVVAAVLLSRGEVSVRPIDIWFGGPPLPLVGESVLYFVSTLFVLTFVLEGLFRLSARVRDGVAVAILVAWTVYYLSQSLAGQEIAYYLLPSFLPAVAIVALLQPRPQMVRKVRLPAAIAWGAICVAESITQMLGMAVHSSYGRLGLWCGAVALIGYVGLSERTPSPGLSWLGQRTFGIFVLHKYVMLALIAVLPVFIAWLGPIGVRVDKLLLFVLTLVASAALTELLRKTPARRIV